MEADNILALGLCPFCRHSVDELITDTRSLDFHLILSSIPIKIGSSRSLHSFLFLFILSIYLSLSLSLSLSLTAISDYRMSVSYQREERREIIYFLPSPSARCHCRGSIPFCVKLRWISRNKPKSKMEV